MRPKCKYCGESDQLYPDPAGYYDDAESEDGLPLLCRWCRDPYHSVIIEALKEKQLKFNRYLVI